MSDFIPNTFQTPNAIVDKLMFLLADGEFRVLMYMVRHILGWQRKAESRRACISLSNFTDGFSYETPDGTMSYPGCGLGINPIRNALKELQKYRIVEAIGKPKAIGQEWELRFMTKDDVDFVGLQLRQDKKLRSRKKQTANARKVSPKNTGVSVQQIGQEGISPTDKETISQTDSQGISPTDNNETHSKYHRKDQTTPVVSVVETPESETPIDTPVSRVFVAIQQLELLHDKLRYAVKDWLKEYSEQEILNAIDTALENRRNGTKIKVVTAYLNSVLANQRREAETKTNQPPEPLRPSLLPYVPEPEIPEEERMDVLNILAEGRKNLSKSNNTGGLYGTGKAAGE